MLGLWIVSLGLAWLGGYCFGKKDRLKQYLNEIKRNLKSDINE